MSTLTETDIRRIVREALEMETQHSTSMLQLFGAMTEVIGPDAPSLGHLESFVWALATDEHARNIFSKALAEKQREWNDEMQRNADM